MAIDENPLWQKLGKLRPSLPHHIDFQRRDYNNELWYLLHDKSNGRFHRLTPSAYRLLNFMNGRLTLQQILAAASDPLLYESPDEIPTHDELIQLIQYLHVADLLVCDFPPDTQELFTRQQKKKQQRWMTLLVNPLIWKFSLGNPNSLLEKLAPLGRFITSSTMGWIWLTVVGYALLQAAMHWDALTHGQLDKILSSGNLLLLWLTYPLFKIFHELGHGLFTKAWGGDVHECGVIIMLGTPLPYVDASAATAFKSKKQRLLVSAAGMAVELFFASIALILWLQTSPSLFRDVLYNIIIIGSVSTLFFNGNPLMRYDGYHLLTDLMDSPNLGTRANQQISYLTRRYGYGLQGLHPPATHWREAIFLSSYSIAAFLYRLTVLATIILVAANYFPKFGLLLACWLIGFQLILPSIKYIRFLIDSPALKTQRKRALSLFFGTLTLVALAFFLIPLPVSTSVEGVVWLPDDARIKTESTGEVTDIFAKDGENVTEGQPILQLTNHRLKTQLALKQASLRESQVRLEQAWSQDRGHAKIFEEDVRALQAEVDLLQQKMDHLIIRSPSKGQLRITQQQQLIGSYLQQGDTIALIETPHALRVRAALTQEEIGQVKQATITHVEVRLSSTRQEAIAAVVSQEVPAGTFELPSPILGANGGGRLTLDGTKPDNTKTAELIFLMDVTALDHLQAGRYGERAYVRFYHPARPLALQWYRLIQQIFIRNFQQSL